MKKALVSVVVALTVVGLLAAGCSQATPSPTPTKAPAAAPAKAAGPTKAPAAAPTQASAQATAAPASKKADWPEKGKAVTIIVPFAAGGATDIAARVLASQMEKELGTSVQVVNKPGAGSQVGLTELSLAKPDGYTLGYTVNPAAIMSYLDPERKATYNRKSLQQVAAQYTLPIVISVKSDSPYKSLKELIEAAKANPEKIKIGTTGLLATPHVGILQLQEKTGAKFAVVHFDGGAPQVTALLGGHIDVAGNVVTEILPHFKSEKVRVLGIMDTEESKFLPGVKTTESQGYKVVANALGGISAPGGTPKEVVDVLSAAATKAMQTPEHKAKMDELGFTLFVKSSSEYAKIWDDLEKELAPILKAAKTQQK